jgi:Ca2+-binding RTX toxin-like protein
LIAGDAGADTLSGDSLSFFYETETANDTIFGGDDGDLIRGQQGNDVLSGDAGSDTLYGDSNVGFGGVGGNDAIAGGLGDDTIDGGEGADTIDGGAGQDTLTGGEGSDSFHLADLGDGVDTITDFTVGLGGDVLDIADLLSGFVSGVSDLIDFVQCDATGGGTTVKVDADGAANGANFTDACVLTGVTTTLTDLVAGNNIEPGG